MPVVLNVNAGDPLTFSAPVAVGQLLVILLGDGYGNGEELNAVADAAGNTYDITSLGGNANGDGDVMAASTIVTRPIAAGDTLTLGVTRAGVFHTYGITFPNRKAYDHAAQAGLYGDGTITVSTTAQAGDLLIAFAAAQDALTQDPGNGWTDLFGIGGDAPDNLMAVAYQVASSAGTFTYQPSRTGGTGGDYAAAAIVVLGTPLPFVPGEAAFTALDPPWAIGPGWLEQGGGFEEHNGAVHLEGALYSTQVVGAVTTTLLTVPPSWRPTAPVTITTPVWIVPRPNAPGDAYVEDIGTPPWNPPASIDVTIGTDGSITLAELPPAINDVPMRGSDPFYHMQFGGLSLGFDTHLEITPSSDRPFCYQIPLGGLTWRIAPPESRSVTWYSLAPYLGDNFEDIDAQYTIDDARVLLRGQVRARKNGAGYGQPLLQELPPAMTSIVDSNENYFTVTMTPETDDSRVRTYACRLIKSMFDGRYGFGLQPYNGKVILLDDTQYIVNLTGGIPRRIWWRTLPWSTFSLPLNADDVVPWRGGGVVPGTFRPVLVPVGTFWDSGFFSYDDAGNVTGFQPNYSGGDDSGLSMIAGLMINPRSWPQSVESSFVTAPPGVPHQATAGATDRTFGRDAFTLTASVSIADLIANYDPAPDWIAIAVGIVARVFTGADSSPPDNEIAGSVSVGDGVPRDDLLATVDMTFESGVGPGWTGERAAWITPPGGSTYDGDPYNPYTNYLWNPADAPSEATIFANGAYEYGFPFGGGANCGIMVAVYPFYNTGRNWILGGDVITFDGAGWQAPFRQGVPQLLTPGSLFAGPGSVGRIPWLRSAGRFGGADAALGPPGGANVAPQRGGDGGSAGVLRIP